MIAFLKKLLRSPEAQREPHYWASVYGGLEVCAGKLPVQLSSFSIVS